MSVENLRVDDPTGKGWANLFMNNLTVYDKITASKFIATKGPEQATVVCTYTGGITPKTVNALYTETAGLVTLQLLKNDFGPLIPANNTPQILINTVGPIDPIYLINHITDFPVWLLIDDKKEICTCVISKIGQINFFRNPVVGSNTPPFIAGEEVTLERNISFTFVRN